MKFKSVLIVFIASGSALLLFACGAAVVKQVGVQQIRDNAIGTWLCDMTNTNTINFNSGKVVLTTKQGTLTLEISDGRFNIEGTIISDYVDEYPEDAVKEHHDTGTWEYDGSSVTMKFEYIPHSIETGTRKGALAVWTGVVDPLSDVQVLLNSHEYADNASVVFASADVQLISASHIKAGFSEPDNSHHYAADCTKT